VTVAGQSRRPEGIVPVPIEDQQPRQEECPMSVVRYSPWLAQGNLQQEINKMFERLIGDSEGDQSSVATSHWSPRVDIREEANRFLIQADIPGVDPKDIEIQMEKGVLSIKGERQTEAAGKEGDFTRVERVYGVFHRRFALPDSADAEHVSATERHGVLEITIPKKPEVQPRRIEIKAD
jgi:HSP20 family protein